MSFFCFIFVLSKNKTMKGTSIQKRFKILYFLTLKLGVLKDKMEELADKIDQGHPMALEALTYYENKIIEALEK